MRRPEDHNIQGTNFMATETDTALYESFDSGHGTLNHIWGGGQIDRSTPGEVTLSGTVGMMEFPGGQDAGHGYGTYTVNAKLDGNGPGPAILLWPGDDNWPGQEIDMAEVLNDGRQYGTVHWDGGGWDGYESRIFDGVNGGEFHDYTVVWEPDQITFKVDGVEKGVITENVPRDYDHGGMNNAISLMNNSPDTSLTVRDVSYTPLGGDAPDQTATGDTGDTSAPEDQGTGNAPQEEIAAPAGDGPVDWDALAAQVMANYEATGSWYM